MSRRRWICWTRRASRWPTREGGRNAAARAADGRTRSPADKAAREKKREETQAELDAIEAAEKAVAGCAKGLQQARRESKAALAARQRLETAPDDPEACLVVGRWSCFRQDDWDAGLKLLAKGSDAALKSLAAKELESKPSAAAERVARGDAWWDMAEHSTGTARLPCGAGPVTGTARQWRTYRRAWARPKWRSVLTTPPRNRRRWP